MNAYVKGALAGLGVVAAWELAWYLRRRSRRAYVFGMAKERAQALGRKLVVIGAPDGGVTSGYGCGDTTIDLAGSTCPNTLAIDITRDKLPFADASVVVVCVCVLEYTRGDLAFALAEIQRVSGGEAFFVGVEPWSLTSFAYPGAQRTLPSELR